MIKEKEVGPWCRVNLGTLWKRVPFQSSESASPCLRTACQRKQLLKDLRWPYYNLPLSDPTPRGSPVLIQGWRQRWTRNVLKGRRSRYRNRISDRGTTVAVTREAQCWPPCFAPGPSGCKISLSFSKCHLWSSVKALHSLLLIVFLARADILWQGGAVMEQKVYLSTAHMCVLDRYAASLPGSYRLKFAVAVAHVKGKYLGCISSNLTTVETLSTVFHVVCFAFLVFPSLVAFGEGEEGSVGLYLVTVNKRRKLLNLLLIWVGKHSAKSFGSRLFISNRVCSLLVLVMLHH